MEFAIPIKIVALKSNLLLVHLRTWTTTFIALKKWICKCTPFIFLQGTWKEPLMSVYLTLLNWLHLCARGQYLAGFWLVAQKTFEQAYTYCNLLFTKWRDSAPLGCSKKIFYLFSTHQSVCMEEYSWVKSGGVLLLWLQQIRMCPFSCSWMPVIFYCCPVCS